jgi:hypothetical protein
MSDTERVRAWRQRLKDNGLVPMTIWVKAETKARYEDLALQSHRSASEVAQMALDAYRLDPALVSSTVTDTDQLRVLIREELDQALAIMTATGTAPVPDTDQLRVLIREELDQALVQAAVSGLVSDTVTATETATLPDHATGGTSGAAVRDTDTDTATDTAGSVPSQGPPAPQVSATDTATITETTAPTVADPEAAAARMQRGQHKLTPRQAAALRAKRQRGAPIKQLMDDYGLSKASVFRYLKTPPAS